MRCLEASRGRPLARFVHASSSAVSLRDGLREKVGWIETAEAGGILGDA